MEVPVLEVPEEFLIDAAFFHFRNDKAPARTRPKLGPGLDDDEFPAQVGIGHAGELALDVGGGEAARGEEKGGEEEKGFLGHFEEGRGFQKLTSRP